MAILDNLKKLAVRKKNRVSAASLFSPRQVVDYYAFAGHEDIKGWLSAESLTFVKYLADFQDEKAIHGNIAEIGVYHGRFFIALCFLMNVGERALAVDVFENQKYNLDNSGRGDLRLFSQNLMDKLGSLEYVEILQTDSLRISPEQVWHGSLEYKKIRFFSVDGCHTVKHTINDLRLASQLLAEGGIIILDDFKNPTWPGVERGAIKFIDGGHEIIPFAYANNKLYLTTSPYAAEYCEYARKIHSLHFETPVTQRIAGNEVVNISLFTPEHCFMDSFLAFFEFSSSQKNIYLQSSGWYAAEKWGVWSDGTKKAEIILPLSFLKQNSTIICISLHAFVTEYFSGRIINIFIGLNLVDSIIFNYGLDCYSWRYRIEDYMMADDNLRISFTVDNPLSPRDAGVSADDRILGVGLRNIQFYNQL